MLDAVDTGKASRNVAKEKLLPEMIKTGASPTKILEEKGLGQISNEDELVNIAREIIKNNPKQVEQFKSGKEAVLMFFVGQVMKACKGRANPDILQKLLKEELAK